MQPDICACAQVSGCLLFWPAIAHLPKSVIRQKKMIYLMNIAFGIAPQNNPVKVKARQRILDLFFSM